MPVLHDTHCHLAFSPDAATVARDADAAGGLLLCNTVTPEEYGRAASLLDGYESVRVGVGLHPWWVDPERIDEQLAAFERGLEGTRFVAEVGLDFGPRHEATREAQVRAFVQVARLASARCRDSGERCVLSLHAVRAADAVLDVLEDAGCLPSCDCILHWFSCGDEELRRAARAGVRFSVNPRMLGTRRGRNRVRQIPRELLLLETDLPAEGAALSFDELQGALAGMLDAMCELRGEPDLADVVDANTRALLGM